MVAAQDLNLKSVSFKWDQVKMAVFICSFVLLFIFCSALGFIQRAVWHTSSQQNYYWFICQLFLLPVNHLAFHSFTKSVCFVQQIVQNPTSVSAFPCTQQTLFLSAIIKVLYSHLTCCEKLTCITKLLTGTHIHTSVNEHTGDAVIGRAGVSWEYESG